jgi:UDP-glucose 4-epimerase
MVFGGDYPTADGTGVRDYIHVVDLANGHLKALQALRSRAGINIWNLGTGISYSVLEIIRSFEAVTGVGIPYQLAPRRAGDVAQCWADPRKAGRELGWRAQRDLAQMLADTWRWQSRNPYGYLTQPQILQTLTEPGHATSPSHPANPKQHVGSHTNS